MLTHETRRVDALTPYTRNSRTHNDAQIAQIAASIDEFGMVGGIVVRAGVIAKGHGTLAAVRMLYAAGKLIYPPPGRKAGAEPYPAGEVPVIDASGWDASQFRAYVIADNKLALNAGWDYELLKSEIDDLATDGFDVALLGFGADEIAALDAGGDEDLEDLEGANSNDEKEAKLRWGKNAVPLTEQEAEGLQALLDKHVEQFGMTAGFARQLLRRV